MLSFSFQKQKDAGILTFSGEITSSDNEDFKSALLISLSNADKVVINFDDVSAFDRICMQSFCTALKIARKLKKDLIFNILAITEKARLTGACSVLGCYACGKRDCLLSQSAAMEATS